MPFPAGPKAIPLFLVLLAAVPARLVAEGDYAPGQVYVVETGDGGAFTSEIADCDEDSLYFADGSAISRGEVSVVRRPGVWPEERTFHPRPEPEPEPPREIESLEELMFRALMEALVGLLVDVFD